MRFDVASQFCQAEVPQQEPSPGPAPGHARILVMDDEEGLRELYVELLTTLGYGVEAVADGHQAVRAYSAARDAGTPFDAVIMDLTVPGGMGGRDAMRELLRLDPEVRAIVASGYSTDSVLAKPRASGFQSRLSKPFTVTELSRALEEVLG